jgi:hypothetical protein
MRNYDFGIALLAIIVTLSIAGAYLTQDFEKYIDGLLETIQHRYQVREEPLQGRETWPLQ